MDIRIWQVFLLSECQAHGWRQLVLWARTGSLDAESTSVGDAFSLLQVPR